MYLIDEDDIVSRECMKTEALTRMEKHKLSKQCLFMFENSDMVMCSEKGIIRDLNCYEKQLIDKYEKESGCLVYHLIHSFANIGETYELLRVSNYSDDWGYENNRLEQGVILVYSENISHPEWSESGSILICNIEGALLRIG